MCKPLLVASRGPPQKTKKSGAEGNGKYCKPKSLAKIKSELEGIGVEVVLNEEVIIDANALEHDATHRVANVVNRSIEKAQKGELDEQKVAAGGEAKDGEGDESRALKFGGGRSGAATADHGATESTSVGTNILTRTRA